MKFETILGLGVPSNWEFYAILVLAVVIIIIGRALLSKYEITFKKIVDNPTVLRKITFIIAMLAAISLFSGNAYKTSSDSSPIAMALLIGMCFMAMAISYLKKE